MNLTEEQLRKLVQQVLSEVVEPFELDLVNKLRGITKELDKVAFAGGEFDGAFEEIAAAHTAISGLINKLKQPANKPVKRSSGTYATAAEGKKQTKKLV